MARDCFFCKLVTNRALAPHWIAESAGALALLSPDPASQGHTVIVPKRHSSDLSTVPGSDWIAINQLTLRVVKLLRSTLGGRGEYLYCGSWVTRGRKFPHLHVHVVPRGRHLSRKSEVWWTPPPEGTASRAELVELARRIRARTRPVRPRRLGHRA